MEIPEDVLVNVMAPPAKQCCGVYSRFPWPYSLLMLQIFIKGKTAELLPATNNPPLSLHVPKPSLTNSHSHSAFGFCAMAISSTDHPQDTNMNDANEMDTNPDADI